MSFFFILKKKNEKEANQRAVGLLVRMEALTMHSPVISAQKPALRRRTVCLPKPPVGFGRFPVLRRILGEYGKIFMVP